MTVTQQKDATQPPVETWETLMTGKYRLEGHLGII